MADELVFKRVSDHAERNAAQVQDSDIVYLQVGSADYHTTVGFLKNFLKTYFDTIYGEGGGLTELPDLQHGYVWQGNASNRPVATKDLVLDFVGGKIRTLFPADLDDNSSPHVLTQLECCNTALSNAGATASHTFVLPPAFHGGSLVFNVDEVQNVVLQPTSGFAFYFKRGETTYFELLAQDRKVQNIAPDVGDQLFAMCRKINNVWYWFLWSDSANFTKEP